MNSWHFGLLPGLTPDPSSSSHSRGHPSSMHMPWEWFNVAGSSGSLPKSAEAGLAEACQRVLSPPEPAEPVLAGMFGIAHWMPAIPAVPSLAALPGLQFSMRAGPLPSEPLPSSTQDIEHGDSDAPTEASTDVEATDDIQAEDVESTYAAGPFLARKRSETQQLLPCTLEKSMQELKKDLWGVPGAHRNSRKGRRNEWKDTWKRSVSDHESRLMRTGGSLCCSTEVLNGLCVPFVCVMLFVLHLFMGIVFPIESQH